MRHRERNIQKPAKTLATLQEFPGPTTHYDVEGVDLFDQEEIMEDVVHQWPPPNGKRVLGPLRVSKIQHHEVGSIYHDVRWQQPGFPSIYFDDKQVVSVPHQHAPYSSPDLSLLLEELDLPIAVNLQNRVLNAAASNAQQNSALLLVTIAEAHKGVGLAVSYFKDGLRLVQAMRRLRRDPKGTLARINRRRRQSGRSIIRTVQDQWLRYRYGIRATMYEIQNLIKAIDDGDIHFQGTAYDRVRDFSIYEEGVSVSLGSLDVVVDRDLMITHAAKAGYYYSYDNAAVPHEIRTLGIDQIIPSIWELVPYSFVCDWFINTGDFFASLPPTAAKAEGSYLTASYEYRVRTKVVEVTPDEPAEVPAGMNPEDFFWHTGPSSVRVFTNIRREVDPGDPALPSLNIRLDGAKIADLVALFLRLKR